MWGTSSVFQPRVVLHVGYMEQVSALRGAPCGVHGAGFRLARCSMWGTWSGVQPCAVLHVGYMERGSALRGTPCGVHGALFAAACSPNGGRRRARVLMVRHLVHIRFGLFVFDCPASGDAAAINAIRALKVTRALPWHGAPSDGAYWPGWRSAVSAPCPSAPSRARRWAGCGSCA